MWRPLVRDSKYKGCGTRARCFFLTHSENRRTGGVGNSEGIAEIFFTVSKSMERQEMERTVRHNSEVRPLKKRAQRCDKFGVERFQMTVRGTQKWCFKSSDIFAPHAEFRELKSKQLQKVSHSR